VDPVPIRAPHGRGAAYRAVWQWPLHSPTRLVMTVVVIVLVLVGVTFGLSFLRGPQPTQAAPQPTASAPTGAKVTGTGTAAGSGTAAAPSSEPSPLPLNQAPPEALTAAERWAKAWVRPPAGTSTKQWLDALKPLTTDQYFGVLSGVDPENIPATRVTGKASAVRVADRNVQAEVPTDALTLRILVVETDDGWQVAGYDRS
jgi:hypothetical protein